MNWNIALCAGDARKFDLPSIQELAMKRVLLEGLQDREVLTDDEKALIAIAAGVPLLEISEPENSRHDPTGAFMSLRTAPCDVFREDGRWRVVAAS